MSDAGVLILSVSNVWQLLVTEIYHIDSFTQLSSSGLRGLL